MQNYLNISKKAYLCLYACLIFILTFIQQEYIIVPQLSNMPVLNEAMKARIFEGFYKYRWLMLLVPVGVLLIRISLVGMCMYLGSFFIERWQHMKYAESWNIALKSDVILLLFSASICTAAILSGPEASLEFSHYCSFAFLVDPNITEQWLLVPIAALNIFEVCYWFFMAKLVAVQTGGGYWNSFKFVLSTYGIGYLFYIVFIMFLLLYLA